MLATFLMMSCVSFNNLSIFTRIGHISAHLDATTQLQVYSCRVYAMLVPWQTQTLSSSHSLTNSLPNSLSLSLSRARALFVSTSVCVCVCLLLYVSLSPSGSVCKQLRNRVVVCQGRIAQHALIW